MSYFPHCVDFSHYRSILVTGMGGGCDVFTAHSLALDLLSLPALQIAKPKIVFGNCVGYRKSLSKHIRKSDCLFQVCSGNVLEEGKQYWGETGLEESLFDEEKKNGENDFFGPFLSIVMYKTTSSDRPKVEDVTKANIRGLLEAWEGRFDLIIAVDNGGDSITGGIDFREHVDLGRDTQVSLALKAFQNRGKGEYLHVVMGPGCDGESDERQLRDARDRMNELGQFVGEMDLTSLLHDTFARTKILGDTRTPNIMYNASRLLHATREEDKDTVKMVVPRGKGPHSVILAKWLCSAWIFRDRVYCSDMRCYQWIPCSEHQSYLPRI